MIANVYRYLTTCQAVTHCVCVLNHACSSVHENFQGRILELVAISYSRGSFWPRDQNSVSCISCIGRQILYHCTTWEAQLKACSYKKLFTNVHNSIIHTSPKVETTQMFLNWQINKERCIHTMEDSWDELGTHYVKGKKPFARDFVLLESIHRKVQNGQIYIKTETLGLEGGEAGGNGERDC